MLDHYAYQDQANNGNGLNTTIVSDGSNNYSGLNALRERLSNESMQDSIADNNQTIIAVGVPIHFYFKNQHCKPG